MDGRNHGPRRHRGNGLVRLGLGLSPRCRRTHPYRRLGDFFFCARGRFHFTRERSFHCGCNRIANRTFPYCGSDLAATLRADPVEHAF